MDRHRRPATSDKDRSQAHPSPEATETYKRSPSARDINIDLNASIMEHLCARVLDAFPRSFGAVGDDAERHKAVERGEEISNTRYMV